MIEKVRFWLAALSPRERRMVAAAGLLGAVLIGIYGVALPLERSVAHGKLRLEEAVVRHGRIVMKIAMLHDKSRSVARVGPVAFDAFVAASAAQSGFAPEALESAGPGRLRLRVPVIRSGALFAWLLDLEAAGAVVESLAVERGTGDVLTASMTLVRP